MNSVRAALHRGDIGNDVANLQEALQEGLTRELIEMSDPEAQAILERLERERNEQVYGGATAQLVALAQEHFALPATGEVDQATADALNGWLREQGLLDEDGAREVEGRVAFPDGRPAADRRVVAYSVDVSGAKEELAAAVTARDGHYAIRYAKDGGPRPRVPTVDLRVAVLDAAGHELVSSPDVFRPGPQVHVDLTLPIASDDRSEFERYMAAVEEPLRGVPLREVGDAELRFLVGVTGIPAEHMVALVDAARRAETGSEAPIPAEVWYAWLRQGLGTPPEALWARPTDELIQALEIAVEQRLVPRTLADNFESLKQVVERRRLDETLHARRGPTAGLGELLDTMPTPLEPQHRRVVAAIVAEVAPEDEQFAARLQEAGLDPEQANRVRGTLRLGDLAMRHAPMVSRLQPLVAEDPDASLRSLAAVEADRWLDFSYDAGAPDDSELDEAAYAHELRTRVEDLHPSATLAARLQDSTLVLDLPAAGEIPAFLQSHPDFDIVATDIPSFVARTTPDSGPEVQALTTSLQTLQRVKRLGTTWREAGVLLGADLGSALDVVAKGPTQLNELLQDRIEPERAYDIYRQASMQTDTTIALMGSSTVLQGNKIPAIREPDVDTSALASRPTLQALFGSLDTSACRHCRSVLSPAAYFVDLLQFVRNAAPEAFAVLLARRPDLIDLDLSCENTEQELPSIDLALEILENAVGLPLTVAFPPGTNIAGALAARPLSPAIRQVLARTALDLGDDLVAEKEPLQPLDGITHWTVTDRHRRWSLSHHQEVLSALKRPSRVPRAVPLAGLDSAALITDLDRGTLPAALRPRLEQAVLAPEQRPLVASIGIGELERGRRWKVTFALRVSVGIREASNGGGTLKLLADDGSQIAAKTYSARALEATANALAAGRAGGMLKEKLPIGPGYRVKQEVTGSQWQIEYESVEAEFSYVPERLAVTSLSYQSSRNGEELKACPENRNPEAYERLREAVFPWSLPFDLPLAEIRALLERMGSSRRQLAELLGPSTRLSDAAVARERLGLSSKDAELVTKPAKAPGIWELWGLPLQGDSAAIWDGSSGEVVSGKPLDVLAIVSIALQQSGLSYGEFLDVLETRFVKGQSPALSITPPEASRPSDMRLSGLTDPAPLDRLHRFVRLWRKLGWRVHELDLALAGLQPSGDISAGTLTGLAHLRQLHDRLGVPLDELASWWDKPGTRIYQAHTSSGEPEIAPLFDRLFHTLSVRNPPDTDFALNPSRTELASVAAGQPKKLSEKLPSIAAAFGVRQADVAAAFEALAKGGLQDELRLADQPPRVGPLSELWRVISLAKALGLSIDDYFRVRALTGLEPFAGTQIALEFCEAVEFVRESGFTVEELAYLLRHEKPAGLAAVLSDEDAARLLDRVRSALKAVEDEPLDAAAKAAAQTDQAVTELGQALGADPDVVRDLLLEWLTDPRDAGRPAIGVFLDSKLVASDEKSLPKSTDFPAALGVLQRVRKALLLTGRLGVDRAQLRWLARSPAAPGMVALQLDALPVTESSPNATQLFEGWRRLLTLYQLRGRGRGATEMLARCVAAVTRPGTNDERIASARQELTAGLDVPKSLVEHAAQQLEMSELDAFRDPVKLSWLFDLVFALKKLGTSIETANALASPKPEAGAAVAARSLLRSRYGAKSWLEALEPVSNSLRQRQRDALVAYLVAGKSGPDGVVTRPLQSVDELYELYLMDVLMGPCLTTTRLLQGISAIQLFVQRYLLGVEPDVGPTSIDRDRWEWMKNYRVWEANRKVFLYPENWLLPEFLDNRTETLRELEAALNQAEPSHETARGALLGYLDSFADLAQVNVLGMYEHVPRPSPGTLNQAEPRVLYVVGRTANEPYRYFWRKCERFGEPAMEWTGWEHVDLDITGTHIIPFVLEGDFYIAWPVIRKLDPGTDDEHWEVQLAWGRRTASGWSQKKVSRQTLSEPVLAEKNERSTFTFRIVHSSLPDSAHLSVGSLRGGESATDEEVRIGCYVASDLGKGLQPPAELDQPEPVKGSAGSPAAFLDIRVLRKGQERYAWASGASISATRKTKDGISQIKGIDDTDSQGRSAYQETSEEGATYTVVVTYRGQTSEARTLTLDSQMWSWHLWFVFPTDEKIPVPAEESEPEREVKMNYAGSFVLASGADVKWDPDPAPGIPLENIPDTHSYDDGFRERADRAQPGHGDDLKLPNSQPAVTLRKTPGVFQVTPAGPIGPMPRMIWHYADDLTKWFLRLGVESSDAKWLAIADGHTLAGVLRSRARAELERLYEPELEATNDKRRALLELNAPDPPPVPASALEQGVSFDRRAAYALYNWELFLHAPLVIADQFSKQQRFDEARRWLHLVFDPTAGDGGSDPSQYWRCLPLRQAARGEPIQQLVSWLASPDVDREEKYVFRDQVLIWRDNPFRPHAVARWRPSAYQWRVVFSYLDNLLDWGDALFRRDTREALDQAALLYVLAAKLLGPRPKSIVPRLQPPALTYRAVAGRWDAFSNTWSVLADSSVFKTASGKTSPPLSAGSNGALLKEAGTSTLTSIGVSYFCVPQNDKLTEYWDRVEDRLFKIRHCQNIEGVARDLPLWQPPIDPELLVRAVAAGVDIGEVLAGLAAPLPRYRFGVIVQKANELCGELKALGSALLSALEKKDAERLSQLRSGQEIELLELVKQVRQDQLDEANRNVDALRESRHLVGSRYRHYQRLLGRSEVAEPAEGQPRLEETSTLPLTTTELREAERGLGLIQGETDQLARLTETQIFSVASGLSSTLAGVAFAIAAYKGDQRGAWLGDAYNAYGSFWKTLAEYSGSWATRDALIAGYQRRKDEWVFQSNVALRELAQIDKQIAAAQLRVAIAEREETNHQRQIENARALDAFMHNKFTNQQLYSWMTGQLASVFFATYQVALDTAKRAEQALAFEVGQKTSYVRPGYWDTLRKGLLAGEHLSLDLKRMELAYLEHNRRELELTKHISLRQLDPLALIRLRETGTCEFDLREEIFDIDCPAYMRRIKSVALSIPSVTGPYTSVNCRLMLDKHWIRTKQDRASALDPNFGVIQSMIVTSSAVNDSGLFEANLRDERFLPFEGAGAISHWKLELPDKYRQFDYGTISDVVLHLRYAALDGGAQGAQFRDDAVSALDAALKDAKLRPQARLFSLRHEFPSQWARLTAPTGDQRSEGFAITKESFPYLFQDRTLTIVRVDVLVLPRTATAAADLALPTITPPHAEGTPGEALSIQEAAAIRDLLHGMADGLTLVVGGDGSTWTISADADAALAFGDLLLVLTYTVQ